MGEPLMYRSSDMGTVAFLRYRGYESQGCKRVDGQVIWSFLSSDGLLTALDEYNGGTAKVDPRAYNAHFAAVKRELHKA
jgi:hypothetical protein